MTAQEELTILIPESLEIFREKLNHGGKPYTDNQLQRAAMFATSPVLSIGAAMGVANEDPVSIFSTANLMARTVLADFINAGCLSVSAIDRYLDKAEQMVLEQEAKDKEKADREDADSGTGQA